MVQRFSEKLLVGILALLTLASCGGDENKYPQPPPEQNLGLQKIVNAHLEQYGQAEHISAITLTVDQGGKTSTVYAGNTEFNGRSPVTSRNLYQVGSITKSYIAAILLQLEAESKLHSIDDKLSVYLPQYSAWGDVTIRQLLNMTSGIPDYISDDGFLREMAKNQNRQWLPEELVAYARNKPLLFPAGTLYEYSNSNYILAGLVIRQITGRTIEDEMNLRFLGKNNLSHLELKNTVYVSGRYPRDIDQRMVHGYQFGGEIGKYFPLKEDVTQMNMSYAGAAGAIVSDTADTSRWVRSLFSPNTVLPPKQLKELTTLISTKTGKPLVSPNADDPDGFGLGVLLSYLGDDFPGLAYHYEADTMGYRAMYMYIPVQDLIITADTNSYVSSDNNNLGLLVLAVYSSLQK